MTMVSVTLSGDSKAKLESKIAVDENTPPHDIMEAFLLDIAYVEREVKETRYPAKTSPAHTLCSTHVGQRGAASQNVCCT